MKIKINGKYIKFFNEVSIIRSLDTIASVFSFVGRYNPDNELHKEVFRPLSFPKVDIYDNDDKLLLSGKIVNHSFNSQSKPGLWELSGYSFTGVLEDSNIPVGLYPLESNNRNIKDITERIIKPFGLELVIHPSVKKDVYINFEKTIADPSESIKNYISKLASQRNIVTSHDEKGRLVFFRPEINGIARYRFNKENTLEMNLSVRGQGLHSSITILRQPSDEVKERSFFETLLNGVYETAESTLDLLGIEKEKVEETKKPGYLITNNKSSAVTNYSPSVKVLTSGTDTPYDVQQAVKNALASELKNIQFLLILNKIQTIRPGDIVEVKNPDIFLFEYTRLMVNEVSTKEKTTGEEMSLNLVIPEAFTGNQPKELFKK